MDLLSRKIELYETIHGKTSKYLKAWSKVLVIILLVFGGFGIISSLITASLTFGNVFLAISFVLSLVYLALIIFAIMNSKKANKNAYLSNVLIGVVNVVSSIINLIYTLSIPYEEFIKSAGLLASELTSQEDLILKASYVSTSVFSLLVTAVLVLLHIIYMVKRKDLFLKTIEELEEQAGVTSGEEQYTPYINPEG